jgi:hypothetical protein
MKLPTNWLKLGVIRFDFGGSISSRFVDLQTRLAETEGFKHGLNWSPQQSPLSPGIWARSIPMPHEANEINFQSWSLNWVSKAYHSMTRPQKNNQHTTRKGTIRGFAPMPT